MQDPLEQMGELRVKGVLFVLRLNLLKMVESKC